MNVAYTLNFEDYAQARRPGWRKWTRRAPRLNPRTRIIAAVAFAMLILGSVLMIVAATGLAVTVVWPLGVLGVVPALLLLAIVKALFGPSRSQLAKGWRGIGPEGLAISLDADARGGRCESALSWALFTWKAAVVNESAEMVTIAVGAAVIYLPKRALSAGQLEEMRGWLKNVARV